VCKKIRVHSWNLLLTVHRVLFIEYAVVDASAKAVVNGAYSSEGGEKPPEQRPAKDVCQRRL